MSFYAEYFLRENPFPATPILDPTSTDDRINGTIFNSEVMREEIKALKSKLRRKPPLVYIENSDFIRGVGKSALLVQEWCRIQQHKDLTSVYLRVEKKLRPTDFAARFIDHWHQVGNLWSTLLTVITRYSAEAPKAELTQAAAGTFVERYPQMPLHSISLAHFMVYNPDRLINSLARWVYEDCEEAVQLELVQAFLRSYLTEPGLFLTEYPKVLRKHKWDNTTLLSDMYRLLHLGGYEYHYIFLDQFEDVVHGLSGKSLITFNTEMRRLIEACIGYATLVVTLHPGATSTLSSDEGGDITSIAPLDQRHVIDVRSLQLEEASTLVQSYLDHYRTADSALPHSLYPFQSEAIEKIYDGAKGNIRSLLQALNYAIELGVDDEFAEIDVEFVNAHHAEITGRVSSDEIIL